eukprot:TRINITY_DN5724_c0_g1_i1.p2 TRINITY_DN5724_c0_g1~~TRINITY_DN5724_c0_g1_i1.p2  ORF type:complete len:103 (+),score=13.82 TRINITY_DN5724_c0_g1_i1:596-904(+)
MALSDRMKEYIFAIPVRKTGSVLFILLISKYIGLSIEDIECLISNVKPDAVFVETWENVSDVAEVEELDKRKFPESVSEVLTESVWNWTSNKMYHQRASRMG